MLRVRDEEGVTGSGRWMKKYWVGLGFWVC